MNRDRLEQFIAENRDQFDLYDPSEKVWAGIRKKALRPGKSLNWKTILWRAAAIILIFAASFLVQEYLHLNSLISARKTGKIHAIEIPELKEAEFYYTNLINEKILEIEPLLKQYPGLNNELKTGLSELDSIYGELQKDLIDNIANDEVVEAMIQNYRLKLQILENLQDLLHETSKNEEDENNKYDI